MAKMSNHVVVEVWRDKKNPEVTFHITKNDRVLMVHRNALASAKLLFKAEPNELLEKSRATNLTIRSGFNFMGIGRRATATEYRERLAQRAMRV